MKIKIDGVCEAILIQMANEQKTSTTQIIKRLIKESQNNKKKD